MRYDEIVLKPLNTSSEDFNKGIKIYYERFNMNQLTDADVITRLVSTKNDDIKLIPYGLYEKDLIIGFCLMTIYKKEHFTFIGYMALSKDISPFGAGKSFIYSIWEEVQQQTDSLLLFEIEENKALEKMYRSLGIGTLDYSHIMPVLDSSQARIPARMMCYPKIESIKKDSYLKCLQAYLTFEYAECVITKLCSEDAEIYRKYISNIYEELKETLPDIINIV